MENLFNYIIGTSLGICYGVLRYGGYVDEEYMRKIALLESLGFNTLSDKEFEINMHKVFGLKEVYFFLSSGEIRHYRWNDEECEFIKVADTVPVLPNVSWNN